MATDVIDQWGRIDILINNAAIYYDMDRTDQSFEYQQKIMSVNMFGVWLASAAVVPHMIRQRKGKIVNQASDAAFIYHLGVLGDSMEQLPSFNYSWAKWGVVGLTRFMAGVLGVKGINVNCICPGVTLTEATRKFTSPANVEALTQMSALRKTLRPEDLCGAALFFSSDESDLVAGQTLCVDGGLIMA
jgi:3-oxoacyl-[acyl-carrier protein] reductase